MNRQLLLKERRQYAQLVDVDRAVSNIFNHPARSKEQSMQLILTQGFGVDGEERLVPMFTRRVQGASDLLLPEAPLADQKHGLKRRRLDADEFLQLGQMRADADETIELRPISG